MDFCYYRMRDKHLIKARPTLNLNTESSTEIEKFQNITLRPILKMQNGITQILLNHFDAFNKVKSKINVKDDKKYREAIASFLSSNTVFKNQLIGCIKGVMTEKELLFYIKHESEFNKRIIAMQKERYWDVHTNV